MRPETPADIRARLSRLDSILTEANALPADRVLTAEEIARVMARIKAEFEGSQ